MKGFQVLFDIGPLETMARLVKKALQLFSQDQSQKATEHVAPNGFIPLMKHRSGFQNSFQISEGLFDLPEFFVFERYLFG